jgi:hypothetical protein
VDWYAWTAFSVLSEHALSKRVLCNGNGTEQMLLNGTFAKSEEEVPVQELPALVLRPVRCRDSASILPGRVWPVRQETCSSSASILYDMHAS